MFGLLLVSYTLMSADRYLINMLGTDIRKALSFSLPQMGALTTMFTLGIALAGLPGGALIARTSRRTVLLLGVVLFSVAPLLFTQATGFLSMFALSASYFSKTRVAAVGIVNVCFGLGSFVGPWAVGNIRTSTGSWQTPMVVFGVTCIAVAILVALFVRAWFTETKGATQHGDATGGADSLMNRNTIILSILSALYGLIVYGFLGLYPTFLREVLKLTPAEAGGIMPFFGLGSLLSFFAGQLGDRFPVKLVLSAGWVVLIGVGIFLYVPGLSIGMYKLMALLFGIFGGAIVYTNLAGAQIKALRRSLANKGSSMFISSIYAGGALGGYVMGSLVANWGWGVAGQIQVSLLALVGGVLVFGLRPGEMSQ